MWQPSGNRRQTIACEAAVCVGVNEVAPEGRHVNPPLVITNQGRLAAYAAPAITANSNFTRPSPPEGGLMRQVTPAQGEFS